jgi:redox-sensitive bicupin YhaK (pirin superfamily)
MDDMALAARTVARVTDSQRLGPDAQVDDKALVIAPDDPALTDPFLVLAEDWFSEPGFNWHPHRGLETVTLVVDGVLEHGDNLPVATPDGDEATRLMIFSGTPLREPVVFGGPFVMNRPDEIAQATSAAGSSAPSRAPRGSPWRKTPDRVM